MKFAFLIFKYFPYGGMQRDMLRTANELVKRGHTVEIFAMSWQGDLPDAKIKIHVNKTAGLFNYQRYQKFISQAHEAIRNAGDFDFIFGYNRMVGLDAHFAADPCFIERAHKQRSFLYRLLPRVKWFADCEHVIFAKDANTEILMVSETEKAHFQHWYETPSERFHYIPPFLSAERFKLQDKQLMRKHLRDTFNFGQADFVFMLTGSGFHMKGLDRAIKALAALPKEMLARVRVLAVGQDNPRPFEVMAKKLGVAKNLVISKGRPDIPQLMQGADVCTHPAYRENTGLVILEALACGAPMLVTESCGYAKHVTKADAGIVIEMPFEQDKFNQAFLTMIESPKKAEWANNGLVYAKTLMDENDGSAEAKILIALAERKAERQKLQAAA
ncbi:MAG TPA: glycosyltransferase family 4 protein [Methylotenera sp.]|nr:glycosyltransferase family 4 protein [Methylotenera sp.]